MRDKTLIQFETVVSGKAAGIYAAYYKSLLSNLDNSQMEIMEKIIPDIVDSTLHNLLWMLEQSGEVKIHVTDAHGEEQDLNALSDGLAGELYSEDGWISKFSRKEKSLVDRLLDERFENQ